MNEKIKELRKLRVGLSPVTFARQAGLDPDPWQQQVLLSNSKRILLNCARQSGKTTTVAALALWTATYKRGSFCLIFAPSLDQSLEFFRAVASLVHNLGMDSVDPEALRKTGMDLKNGSRIEARPGSERTARGRTADLLVIDEAARVEDGLYFSLRPMLAVSGGSLVMLSTPYGRRGVFYEEWVRGEGWERYQVRAQECPRIPTSFLEEERRSLPDWMYRQEYECSFEARDDQLFSPDQVDALIHDDIVPLRVEMFGA